MPIPRIVRQWNKAGLNRMSQAHRPLGPRHGRRLSIAACALGRLYQTPVNVFAAKDGYVFALTYGPDTDWVKNVLAAGGCELRTRGHAPPADLTAPVSRRVPPRHPPGGTAGVAAYRRR